MISDSNAKPVSNLLGHKGRIFHVNKHEKYIISSSEDSTAIIWNINNLKSESILKHSLDTEVLRSAYINDSLVCCCCSNGNAVLWRNNTDDLLTWSIGSIIDHDGSQIYACEPINNSKYLVTAADEKLYLWDIDSSISVHKWSFLTDNLSSAESFGGSTRNPDNTVFIFDVKSANSDNNILAVALSDGTTRLLDVRTYQNDSNSCISYQIASSHITSVS